MNIPLTDPNDPIYPLMGEMVDKVNGKGSDIYYNTVPLTKREYFAALAMQAIIQSNKSCTTWSRLIGHSVELADILITELNKTNHEHQPKPNDGSA